MIPVFIGWDRRETVAWHVLAHSLLRRSTLPLALTAVGNDTLPAGVWWRGRGPHDSTDFSNARFIVPALMGYTGWAIFMDCDMVALGDISELWAQRDERYPVQVVKHLHQPTETTKFLGAEQSKYSRKNWSSLMLINCGHELTRTLTVDYVNTASGLDLHQFRWCRDGGPGDIHGLWNVLVTDKFEHPAAPIDLFDLKLLHYTLGGPWHGYDPLGAERWHEEFNHMVAGGNPCASAVGFDEGTETVKFITQYQRRFT